MKRRPRRVKPADEELLLYARDLRHLLDVERGQRSLLQESYLATVTSLASALESRDMRTGAHSQRVQRYAVQLLEALHPGVLEVDPGVQYGFLLHDIGKIAIPDQILQKPGPLTRGERRRMQTHTVLGEQMLGGVAVLQGEGLRVVRSHHERWDGKGYPDAIGGAELPVGARVFAVADALDAMTSDRPYRRAMRWTAASTRDRRAVGQAVRPRSRRCVPRAASRSCAKCAASFPRRRTCPVPGTVTSMSRISPRNQAVRDAFVALPSRCLAPAVAR